MAEDSGRAERCPPPLPDGSAWFAWCRPLAHLAIVGAFVLTALAYAPAARVSRNATSPQPFATPLAALVGTAADGVRSRTTVSVSDRLRASATADAGRSVDSDARSTARRASPAEHAAARLDGNSGAGVTGAGLRGVAVLDQACDRGASGGDASDGLVNRPEGTAATSGRVDGLVRNCPAVAGGRAFAQRDRDADPLSPVQQLALKAPRGPSPGP